MSELLFKPYSAAEIEGAVKAALENIQQAELNALANIRAREAALRAFQTYGLRDSTGRPLPPAEPVADANAFEEALRGFELLSAPRPAISEANAGVFNAGTAILRNLAARQNSSGILLNIAEISAIEHAQFGDFAHASSASEQKMRGQINLCTEHAFSPEMLQHAAAQYKAIFDPKRMDNIEAIMRLDGTASWLLDLMKRHALPTVLFEYSLSSGTAEPLNAAALGRYVMSVDQGNVLEYMMLYVNYGQDPDIASSYAHEGRHFWQNTIVPPQAHVVLPPIESVILFMINEADAHAIQSKVNRTFSNRFGPGKRIQRHAEEFLRVFANLEHEDLSLPSKIKKATQAVFLSFLEREFSRPFYLHKYIDLTNSTNANPGVWARTVPESMFLTDNFLARITTVGSAVYLDAEGMERTRRLFIERLPGVISQYNARSAAGPAVDPR